MAMHVASSSNQTSKQHSQSSGAATPAVNQLTFVESQLMTTSNAAFHLPPPSSSSPEQLSVANSHITDEAIALVQDHAVRGSFNGQLSSNIPSYTPGPRGSVGSSCFGSTSGGRPAVPNSQADQVTPYSSRGMTPRHSYSGRQRPVMHVGRAGAGVTSGRRPIRDGSFRPPQPRTSPPPLFPPVNMGQGNYGSYPPDRPLAQFDPSYASNDQFFHLNAFQRPYNKYQGAPPRNFVRPQLIIAPDQTRPFTFPMPHAGMMMPNQAYMDPRFYQEPYGNMHHPLMTHQQPPFANPNFHLYAPIVKQINYYFSDENLPRDKYLRELMDAEGWVPLKIVANFPRVVELTTEIDIIIEALATSTEVVVKETSAKDYKIRKSNNWWRYTYQTGQDSMILNSQAHSSANASTVSQQLQKLTLEGAS